MKNLVIALAVIIVVLLGVLIFYNPAQGPTIPTTPTGTTSPDGHVVVMSPAPNATITSPFVVQGAVTGGGWFFEATFPIKVLDANGTVIGQGLAQAKSDWMSTGTVPFSASITFTKPATATGTIVFTKDNPSANPVNNGQPFDIPIVFSSQ